MLSGLKSRLAFFYYSLRAWPLRRKSSAGQKGTALVAGLFSSPNGIGQGARLLRSGLEGRGYKTSVLDLSPIIQPSLSVLSVPEADVDDQMGPVLLHVNPTEVPKALFSLRHSNLSKRRLIGVWAWELEHPPKIWNFCAGWFDEIWAISDFSAKSLSSLPTPVFHVGYPLSAAREPAKVSWRDRLGLGENFVVFIAFDARSSLARKNPFAALEAFQTAFAGISDVKLLVKASSEMSPDVRERFEAENICILESPLARSDMSALIAACDCHLSLSRAEGLGLVAAEASAAGVPIIVTGWSASQAWADCPNVHLVDYTLIPVSDTQNIYPGAQDWRWAEPDFNDAVEALRGLYAQPKQVREKIAEKSKTWWEENFSMAAFESRIPPATHSCLERRLVEPAVESSEESEK